MAKSGEMSAGAAPTTRLEDWLVDVEARLHEARALQKCLHNKGVRNQSRALLIELAEGLSTMRHRLTLDAERERWGRVALEVYTYIAEDARYGAGQLSRGSQRAPSSKDCDEGWTRVAGIVINAQRAFEAAADASVSLQWHRKDDYLGRAKRAAKEAHAIVDQRNRAFTFHTDPGFSFGEGWHLAAAAVLCGVQIQIGEGRHHDAAVHFLEEAGVRDQIVPYQPRPRANKQLTALVGEAFRRNPLASQERIRAAFLGKEDAPSKIREWVNDRLEHQPCERPKVLVWIRKQPHDTHRNTDPLEIAKLVGMILEHEMTPILFGDPLGAMKPSGCADLTGGWRHEVFQGVKMRRAQLHLFEVLRKEHHLVGQVGVTTAGMDGPALLGLPTIYLTEKPNSRLAHWVGAVPEYVEAVREVGGIDVARRTLAYWVSTSRK